MPYFFFHNARALSFLKLSLLVALLAPVNV
jgi:hypothetical protein